MSTLLSNLKNSVSSLLKGNVSYDNLVAVVPLALYDSIYGDTMEDKLYGLAELASAATGFEYSASAIYCTADMILSPSRYMSLLGKVADSMAGAMAQLLNNVMEALQMQVMLALKSSLGSIFGLIDSILSLISQIELLLSYLLDLPNQLKKLAIQKRKNKLSDEQCEEFVASILSCLLNKYLGDPLEKIQNKIISKINEVGSTVNQAISEQFYDLDVMSNYIRQESFLANKAAIQMEGLYANFSSYNDDLAKKAEEKKNKENTCSTATINSNGTISVKGYNTKAASSASTETNSVGLETDVPELGLGDSNDVLGGNLDLGTTDSAVLQAWSTRQSVQSNLGTVSLIQNPEVDVSIIDVEP